MGDRQLAAEEKNELLAKLNAEVAEKNELLAKLNAQNSAPPKRKESESKENRISDFVKKLLKLQRSINGTLSSSCPDVKLDLLKMRIRLTNMINFVGGKDAIESDDEHICAQLCKVVRTMEEQMREFEMVPLHLRIEGHVHQTKRVEKCQVMSKQRAVAIVRRLIDSGVSRDLLHPIGRGGSVPIGGAEQNRRIELILMTEGDYKKWEKAHEAGHR